MKKIRLFSNHSGDTSIGRQVGLKGVKAFEDFGIPGMGPPPDDADRVKDRHIPCCGVDPRIGPDPVLVSVFSGVVSAVPWIVPEPILLGGVNFLDASRGPCDFVF